MVGPDYFRTLTIPMVAGRTFGREDSADAPQVAIVNQTLARRYFADEDPVGKRFRFGGNTDTPPRVIIGIVGDVIHGQLTTGPDPETYVPLEQYPLRQMTLVLQTARPPELMANLLRQELSSIDPEQPVSDITTMEQMIANSILPQSAAMFMMLIFGFLALVLAMVGLYGVIACSVSQSTREIGVRMALGARPRDILAIFGREGFALVALGTVIGMGASLALTRFMEGLLVGVNPWDPTTFVAVALGLGLAAMIGSLVPVRRAGRVDPMVALRCD